MIIPLTIILALYDMRLEVQNITPYSCGFHIAGQTSECCRLFVGIKPYTAESSLDYAFRLSMDFLTNFDAARLIQH
jgi:hypothetical protein